jgi:hypothetical protein
MSNFTHYKLRWRSRIITLQRVIASPSAEPIVREVCTRLNLEILGPLETIKRGNMMELSYDCTVGRIAEPGDVWVGVAPGHYRYVVADDVLLWDFLNAQRFCDLLVHAFDGDERFERTCPHGKWETVDPTIIPTMIYGHCGFCAGTDS